MMLGYNNAHHTANFFSILSILLAPACPVFHLSIRRTEIIEHYFSGQKAVAVMRTE